MQFPVSRSGDFYRLIKHSGNLSPSRLVLGNRPCGRRTRPSGLHMNTMLRLIPHVCALGLLAACGAAKAATPAPAEESSAALLLGAWTCKTEGGADMPDAVMEFNAAYLSDGTAKLVGVIKARQDDESLEINVISHAGWTVKDKMLRHEVTYETITSATLGGAPLDRSILNKVFADIVSIDPSVNSSDAEVLNLTDKQMVLGETDGGITTCERSLA